MVNYEPGFISIKPFNLRALVNECISLFTPLLQKHHFHCEQIITCAFPQLLIGYPELLKQLLIILFNARYHADHNFQDHLKLSILIHKESATNIEASIVFESDYELQNRVQLMDLVKKKLTGYLELGSNKITCIIPLKKIKDLQVLIQSKQEHKVHQIISFIPNLSRVGYTTNWFSQFIKAGFRLVHEPQNAAEVMIIDLDHVSNQLILKKLDLLIKQHAYLIKLPLIFISSTLIHLELMQQLSTSKRPYLVVCTRQSFEIALSSIRAFICGESLSCST